MSFSTVRARLFVVIAAMAFLASLTIGVAYAATEADRLQLQADARTASQLFALTSQLSAAIRDEESALDDYLLSNSQPALDRYRAAVESEVRLTARIAAGGGNDPTLLSALASLTKDTEAWRSTFAEPAISAIASGSTSAIRGIVSTVVQDQDESLASVDGLVDVLTRTQDQIAQRDDRLAGTRTLAGLIGIVLMLLASVVSVLLVRRWVTRPLDRLLGVANSVQSGVDVKFEAERNDEIGQLGHALERMRLALQGDAERSSVLNRFTEVTTFATDDAAVAEANLEALELLVAPDAAVTHVLNRSKDRAIPEGTIGTAIGEVLPLNMLSQCPSIVRGSIYVTNDATQPLSVRCPIYPVEHGTLACVPLAHGEVVGAVHLAWDAPNAFPLELRASVARIAEHAALAIGNRRLLAALRGMASTDARTGLANSRAFDQALEDALAARREDESIAVLMLDLDHFKDFNDRHGHPSGDEALRAFSDILRSCLRDGDVAARYGGEEFAVMLPAVDEATAFAVAERIRTRTESSVISLALGITDRISVSIGVAAAPAEALDRVSLLRLADEALYRAKQAGRNRIDSRGDRHPASARRQRSIRSSLSAR
jgi:diguanylate cyclase (GGDEF)-like protein